MQVQNVVGYMLENGNRVVELGDSWLPMDSLVYLCLDIETAKRILAESQQLPALEPNVVWNTIYRVRAKQLNAVSVDKSMIWTNESTKIIVDVPVFYSKQAKLTEAQLLNNARQILPGIMAHINRGKKK